MFQTHKSLKNFENNLKKHKILKIKMNYHQKKKNVKIQKPNKSEKKILLKILLCLESIPLDINYEPDYDDKDYYFETNFRIILKPMKK